MTYYPRMSAALEIARTVAAILFIPALCVFGAGLVYILWLGGWEVATAETRIHYLGSALIGVMVLIACGVLWLQKRDLPSVSVKAPGGAEVTIGEVKNDGGDQVP